MSTTIPMVNYLQQRVQDIKDNPHLLPFYARSGCKYCYGRGTRRHSTLNTMGQWTENTTICSCVTKAIQKESKELRQTNG